MNVGTEYRRNFMVTVREVVCCLRQQRMSHKRRQDQMIVLNLMIERERKGGQESDFDNTCQAIQDVLRHIAANDELTHTGVKAGLALIETIAQQRIEDWFVPSLGPQGPSGPPGWYAETDPDHSGDIPF